VTHQKPIRLLVMQFARLGDTIQSLMALRAAHQLYPQLEITMVVHENFGDAARSSPWIKDVIAFPTEKILAPILSGHKNSADSLGDLAHWMAPLLKDQWDFVVNWSFNEASSYLCGLLPAKVKLGFSRRNDGTFACLDGWSHYIQTIIQSETEQDIHLTDILTTQLLTSLQIHVGVPQDPGDSTVTSKSFFQYKKEEFVCEKWNHPGKKWIAIQLGGSRPSRQWQPAQWAKLASMILRRHDETQIILLGTPRERNLEKAFFEAFYQSVSDPSQFATRIVSKVGTTPFHLWAQIIAGSQWLLTTDNSGLHMASVLGTRVLNVSQGDVRFTETGPYGNGHYVIKNSNSESAYAVWTYANTEWQHRRETSLFDHFVNLGQKENINELEVYRSKIRPADQGGGLVYESLHTAPISFTKWYAQALSHIAREWYCGWVPPIGQEISRMQITPELIQTLRKIEEGVQILDQIFSECAKTANQLHEKSKNLKSEAIMRTQDRAEIQELGLKLQELEKLIERVGSTQTPLAVFSRFNQILMHNIQGRKIAELAEETAGVYRFLKIGSQSLKQWIEHTVQLARPVAVQPQSNVVQIRSPKHVPGL
jgi:ADP-heptose:LPS heptosyltransferase